MARRALISVSDKRGLKKLLKTLAKYDFEIISSGGTAKKIRELGYNTLEVAEYTGCAESPDGLLKTLHPKIHGGLLLNPHQPRHRAYMAKQEILPVDLLVVNLYPFEKTAAKRTASFREIVENIDIGGPAMIRAAAKASLLHDTVTVVVEPSQYSQIIEEMEKTGGNVGFEVRRKIAVKAFARTAQYDAAIKNYLERWLKSQV